MNEVLAEVAVIAGQLIVELAAERAKNKAAMKEEEPEHAAD